MVVSIGRDMSTEMPPRKDLVSGPVIRESRVIRVCERERVDCGGVVIRIMEMEEVRFSLSEEGMWVVSFEMAGLSSSRKE
jgi:hypothetical protein